MVKKEEEMRKDELENKSLEDLFSEAQETLEEAQARRAEEEASFSKVKYFTMDKERTYRIRILPLPPTSPRRGYEYPLHEYMMKIKNPANGKIRYINACRATEAGLSVDLIDTYRKLALKEVKGDKDMEDKIKGGSFGGGLGMDYKHAMYIYDLDNRDDGMLLWKASNGQFKALEEEKETFWKRLIEKYKNPKQPCPISSWNMAFPVEIKKKKGAKTEYVFSIDPFADPMKMTNEELKALVNATPVQNHIYRFTKFQLEAEIFYLKQYDEENDFNLMESQEIQDVIARIKGELPADDNSSFSFDSGDNDNSGNLSFDEILALYDEFQEKGGKEKSEEGQELRATVIEYIKRKGLEIMVTRKKTISNLLDEIEDALDDMDGEPKDVEKSKVTSVNKKSENMNDAKDDDGESDNEDGEDNDDDKEPDSQDEDKDVPVDKEPEDEKLNEKHNDDTNEPALRRRRRRNA